MKKTLLQAAAIALAGILTLSVSGCQKKGNTNTLKVGATPVPHASILNLVKEDLASQGITLEVVEFTDYVTPNEALESGEIDANYFQHLPYLEDFNKQNGTHIVSVGAIHVEPMGLYGGKQKSLDPIK